MKPLVGMRWPAASCIAPGLPGVMPAGLFAAPLHPVARPPAMMEALPGRRREPK